MNWIFKGYNKAVMEAETHKPMNQLQSNSDTIRDADGVYQQNLLGGDDRVALDFSSAPASVRNQHPQLTVPNTPPINYQNIAWMPRVNVSEWLEHTSKMVLFEWLPLTYFVIASVISPKDDIGCSKYAIVKTYDLLTYVFGPILALRFIGSLFFNT